MNKFGQGLRELQVPPAVGRSGVSGQSVQAEPIAHGSPEGAPGRQIRILVADDHHVLREGLVQRLEKENDLDVVAQASDGEEAVRLAAELSPDVVVLDIGMPKLSGLEATKQINKACPGVAVLVLSVHDDDQHILGLLRAGATGYHSKTIYGNELVQAIRSVAIGQVSLQRVVATKLVALAGRYAVTPVRQKAAGSLTPRELEVLSLVTQGFGNKGIALALGLKPRSVKGHLTTIFSKLSVSTRTEAVLAALKAGLLATDDIASPGREAACEATGRSMPTGGHQGS